MTKIRGGAFSQCESLESVEIPEGVTHIESDAFANCKSLTQITIPYSVEEIGHSDVNWEVVYDSDSGAPHQLQVNIERRRVFEGTSLQTVRLPKGFKYSREELGIPVGAQVVYY